MTGGVGEHAAPVRAAVGSALGHLGVALDPRRNDDAAGDADISAEGAPARTVVVTSREDVEIRRQVTQLLGDGMDS
jgi:acetate kinase